MYFINSFLPVLSCKTAKGSGYDCAVSAREIHFHSINIHFCNFNRVKKSLKASVAEITNSSRNLIFCFRFFIKSSFLHGIFSLGTVGK